MHGPSEEYLRLVAEQMRIMDTFDPEQRTAVHDYGLPAIVLVMKHDLNGEDLRSVMQDVKGKPPRRIPREKLRLRPEGND